MMRTRGVYLHIPFCQSLCHYCDFTRLPLKKESELAVYVDHLCREIKSRKNKEIGVDTIYFGGGTPSLLDESLFERIFQALEDSFVLVPKEITLEVNPNDINQAKANSLKKIGFNRVSMGAQSFNNSLLRKMGRRHNEDEILGAFNALRKAGFDNLSLDLIFGLPGQKEEDIDKDLHSLKALGPEHVSWYNLILEEGTPWYREWSENRLALLTEENEMYFYEKIIDSLEGLGFHQYEISNFSQQGFESKHNLKYWHLEEYEGFGLGASSLIEGIRYKNSSQLEEYQAMVEKRSRPLGEWEILSRDEQVFEYIIMAMRLTEGLGLEDFYRRFGIDLAAKNRRLIDSFLKDGYLEEKEGVLAFTKKGFEISNYFFRQIEW